MFEFQEDKDTEDALHSLATTFKTDSSHPYSNNVDGQNARINSRTIENSPRIVTGGMSHYHRVKSIKKPSVVNESDKQVKVPNFIVQPSEAELVA